MKIAGSTALVTGANRGLGRAFVEALRDAGCAKIYAASRNADSDTSGGGSCRSARHHRGEEVAAAAAHCSDVDLLINNAGVARFKPALGAPTMDDARLEMETNYFGTLAMCRAFAPVLKKNGGGAMVNMLSVVSFFNAPMQATYCASKAAEWSLTKAVRFELHAQSTHVIGVYAGYIDTDMTAGIDDAKSSPAAIATAVMAGIEAGSEDFSPTNARAASLTRYARTTAASMRKCRSCGIAGRRRTDSITLL